MQSAATMMVANMTRLHMETAKGEQGEGGEQRGSQVESGCGVATPPLPLRSHSDKMLIFQLPWSVFH